MGCRSHRCCLSPILLLCACGTSNSGGTTTNDISEAVELMMHGDARYGFIYYAPPPEGEHFELSVFVGAPRPGCDMFDNSGELPQGNFWYLSLETGSSAEGVYEAHDRVDAPNATEVHLTHFPGDEEIPWLATSGTVALSAYTQDRSQPRTVTLDLGFPADPSPPGDCRFVANGDTGEVADSTCVCRNPNGTSRACAWDRKSDCCINRGPVHARLVATVQAKFCSAMCLTTGPELGSYCQP